MFLSLQITMEGNLQTFYHSLLKIRDYNHAHHMVFEYIDAYYNTRRIHSYCGYRSPFDYEKMHHKTHNTMQISA